MWLTRWAWWNSGIESGMSRAHAPWPGRESTRECTRWPGWWKSFKNNPADEWKCYIRIMTKLQNSGNVIHLFYLIWADIGGASQKAKWSVGSKSKVEELHKIDHTELIFIHQPWCMTKSMWNGMQYCIHFIWNNVLMHIVIYSQYVNIFNMTLVSGMSLLVVCKDRWYSLKVFRTRTHTC